MIGALIARRNVPKAYDAINLHDLEAFLEDSSEDAVFVYPGTFRRPVCHGRCDARYAIVRTCPLRVVGESRQGCGGDPVTAAEGERTARAV